FKKEDIDFIKKVTNSRTDDIAKAVNENLRADNISENIDKYSQNRKKLFSPTAFHARFEALGSHVATNSYNKSDIIIYLLDGSKEVVDKYPTTMHNVIGRLKNYRTKTIKRLTKL